MIRILPSVGFEAVSSAHFPTHLPRLRHSSGDNRASLPIPNTRPLRHWIGREPAMVLIDGHRPADGRERWLRSEEHTSELQSLMRISYAVFCLKKKTKKSTSKQ